MGGATEMSLKRVARYCDGWMPIDVLLREPEAMVAKMREVVSEEGRNPDEIELSAFASEHETATH